MSVTLKLISIIFFITGNLRAQEAEVTRLINNELQMRFPSIYFKYKSPDYAAMPYTADSCFKFIAVNFDKNLNSLVLWRDSAETELLANKRIQKIKAGLKKYLPKAKPEIYSMGNEQKVSRRTIKSTSNKEQIAYLLTCNAVFEISSTHINKKVKYNNHVINPKITCWGCWRNGFHIIRRAKYKKMIRKAEEKNKS